MTSRSGRYIIQHEAISIVRQRAIDAHTVEDALRYHDELIDLLSMEVVHVRNSALNQADRDAAIRDLNASAAYHRDVVDRLTDIVEAKKGLFLRS